MARHEFHGSSALGRRSHSSASGLRGLKNLIFVGALGLGFAASQAAVAADANVDIGNKLADMLRSGRSVVSASQPLINNPDLGDKGLTGEKLVHDAAAIYADRVGAPLLTDDLSERDRRLLDAQMRAMQRIVDEH